MDQPSGSLLRPEDFGPLTSAKRGLSLRTRLNRAGERLIDGVKDRWQRPGFRRGSQYALVALVLAGLVAAYLSLRPRSVPDYLNDDLDDVLDYTLLSADFNKLPLRERLSLMKNLIERFKGMDGGDSALMAAFAAGLSKTALEQARENMERLAVDLWDDAASRYKDVPVADRKAYLDNTFLEFSKLMEETAGIKGDESDAERLAEAKQDAQRDMQRAPDPKAMTSAGVNPLVKLMQDRGQKVSSPEQRGRMAKFSRDMVRHLRGQNIDTGEPDGSSPAAPGSRAGGSGGPGGKPPIRPGGKDPAKANRPNDGEKQPDKETVPEDKERAKEREQLEEERRQKERREQQERQRERRPVPVGPGPEAPRPASPDPSSPDPVSPSPDSPASPPEQSPAQEPK